MPTPTPRPGAHNGDTGEAARTTDPAYDLPLVGTLVRELDRFRLRLPLGDKANDTEAAVLRAEARALRIAANYLDARALQLERLSKGDSGRRIERVRLDTP